VLALLLPPHMYAASAAGASGATVTSSSSTTVWRLLASPVAFAWNCMHRTWPPVPLPPAWWTMAATIV